MDINKLIMESIQSVISESAVPEDLQPGAKEAAEAAAKRVADKVIHGEVPEELQAGAETKKMVARRLLNQGKEYANELWSKTKKFGQDNFTLDPDKIDLPKTGMTGAAIAAGLGALALRRRMKNAKRK